MTITSEQQIELVKFPTALRLLVERELAAGNSIIEVGHGFPAPPVGAYLKLANKVSTRARATGDLLSFYERHSSSYSGEFTDAQRFYFVLEPPNPPPPEPDMDAIRKSYEPPPYSPQRDMPTSRSSAFEAGWETTLGTPQGSEPSPAAVTNIDSAASQALSIKESATGSTRVLHFRDQRPPQQVKSALEREVRTLFTPTMEHGVLCLRATANVVGADYDFLLRFEAALLEHNCYSLRMDVSWAAKASSNDDYYRQTSGSWFARWTGDFMAANAPLANEGSAQLYRQLCDETFNFEQQLDSVPAIQQTILAAVKRGAAFQTSHKEGGTNIYWKNGRYVRSDYGDYPDEQQFRDDTEFLKMLYQFCHWDVTRNSGKDQLSEFDTWRLILRRMDRK